MSVRNRRVIFDFDFTKFLYSEFQDPTTMPPAHCDVSPLLPNIRP